MKNKGKGKGLGLANLKLSQSRCRRLVGLREEAAAVLAVNHRCQALLLLLLLALCRLVRGEGRMRGAGSRSAAEVAVVRCMPRAHI